MGGKPEAIAIPKQSGSAIKKTKNPDNKSLRQFSISPAIPILGTRIEVCICMTNPLEGKTIIKLKTCHFTYARLIGRFIRTCLA
jgi:hypothetical protein